MNDNKFLAFLMILSFVKGEGFAERVHLFWDQILITGC